MKRLVAISFRTAGKLYDFDAGAFTLMPGDRVIVETDRGRSLGTVVHAPREVADDAVPADIRAVQRMAEDHDLALAEQHTAREREAYRFCQDRIRERGMDMKLVRAEYLFDGSKIVFFFTAEGRVDFRELVKDLAHQFRTRIEMRQIGVRDEAKQVGGIGVCGRELCCCTFLRGFAPISVKMAKDQGLALNPTKISGQCGRLLCCLEYEHKTYCELRKDIPKVGKKVPYGNGVVEVVAVDVIGQKITARMPDGSRSEITLQQLQEQAEAPTCGGCRSEVQPPAAKPAQRSGAGQPQRGSGSARDGRPQQGRGEERSGRDRRRRRPRSGEPRREEGAAATPSSPAPESQPPENRPSTDSNSQGERPPRRRNRPRRRGGRGNRNEPKPTE